FSMLSTAVEKMQYEELLTKISKSGPCYRWVITNLLAMISMKAAFDMFILNLVTASVPFHCAEITLDNQTVPWSSIAHNASMPDNFTINSFICSRPRLFRDSDGSLRLESSSEGNASTVNRTSVPAEACSAWTFLPDPPTRWTMFMEYSMVCERQYLMDRIQTMLQFGICLSTVFGPLGDIIGRKTVLVGFAYLDISCNIAVIFVQDLTLQMVLRFIMGFGAPAVIISTILITELVAEDYRGIHGNLMWILFCLGYSGSAAISYFIHNWRVQTAVACAIAGVGYATFIPVIPESPRWLLTRGYTKRAKKILKEICKFSGCKEVLNEFNFEHSELVEPPDENKPPEENCIFKIFPRENLCRLEYFVTVGVLSFNFFTVSLVYFALSFKRDFITKDIYLNVLISGLLEIPAYILAWQLTNRAGRKYTSMANMAFSGVGLIIMPFIPTNPNIVFQGSSVLAIAVKFSVTVAFSILAVYGSEVLPTKVRSCSFFVASILMRGAQLLAPEIGGALASLYDNLPSLLYGVICVLASLTILLLPESKDRPMPNTVAEMEPVGCPCGARRTELATNASGNAQVDEDEMKPLQVFSVDA
ncbi:hypothetical protein BOX15_Mlig026251g1, partial [Macrostomum lignano]